MLIRVDVSHLQQIKKQGFLIVPKKIVFCIIILMGSSTLFAETCIPWGSYSSSPKNNSNLTVGKILINSQDVFDLSLKKESTFLHRWANRLHIQTKGGVVRRQLLFTTGQVFELSKLQESERLLRANSYIKNASVVPVEVCNANQVTVEVTTQDNWTLTPGVSFGRSGGKNKSGIELEEHNLLGFGKSISLSYKQKTSRDSLSFSYLDPQLFGSRKQLSVALQDNSDGRAYGLSLGLPFYAFDSPQSWGVNVSTVDQENSVYKQGEVIEKIGDEKKNFSLFYGWSTGVNNNRVIRFKTGWKYNQDDYSATPTSTTLPTSLVESYPFFTYESLEQKYITTTNFRTMDVVEDVSLGQNFSLEVGLLHPSMGSDDKHLKLSGQYAKGYELGKRDLGFIGVGAVSYLGSGIRQGEQVSLTGEWYSFNSTGNDFYLKGQLKAASNLQVGEQILQGETNGLRGYPIGYQTGDKSALLTLERRFRFNAYPLHLVKFGAVAFADVGTAWGGDYGESNINVLTDIGFGFRIVPTRSSSLKSIHIDFAIPLNDQNNVDDFQFSISTKQSF